MFLHSRSAHQDFMGIWNLFVLLWTRLALCQYTWPQCVHSSENHLNQKPLQKSSPGQVMKCYYSSKSEWRGLCKKGVNMVFAVIFEVAQILMKFDMLTLLMWKNIRANFLSSYEKVSLHSHIVVFEAGLKVPLGFLISSCGLLAQKSRRQGGFGEPSPRLFKFGKKKKKWKTWTSRVYLAMGVGIW